jgi:hypothetical protein
MEQRTLTLRTAMRTARAAAGVRVHIVDREWAWALWRNGWEVSRPHFPAGELVAVGRRGATGELVLYVSRDLPHDSHVRAILPLMITTSAIALATVAHSPPASVPVQVAAIYQHGTFVVVEQSPRVGILPDCLAARGNCPPDAL